MKFKLIRQTEKSPNEISSELFYLAGCPSIQHCSAEVSHHFLLPSILTETINLVSSLTSDTTVKVFERTRCVPLSSERSRRVCHCRLCLNRRDQWLLYVQRMLSCSTHHRMFLFIQFMLKPMSCFLCVYSCPQGDIYVPLSIIQHISQPPGTTRSFILIGRSFSQWHCSTEQGTSYVRSLIITSSLIAQVLNDSTWISAFQGALMKMVI